MIVKLLGEIKMLATVADAEEDMPFAVKRNFGSEMIIAVSGRFTHEDNILVSETVVFQACPHDGRIAGWLALTVNQV